MSPPRWRKYEAAQSALQLAIADQYPNLTLGPGYQYDFGANKYLLSPSLTLPIFNQNQGPIAAAIAARQQQAARFTALQAGILGAIDRAACAYRTANAALTTADALVAAARAGKRVRRAFAAGASRPANPDRRRPRARRRRAVAAAGGGQTAAGAGRPRGCAAAQAVRTGRAAAGADRQPAPSGRGAGMSRRWRSGALVRGERRGGARLPASPPGASAGSAARRRAKPGRAIGAGAAGVDQDGVPVITLDAAAQRDAGIATVALTDRRPSTGAARLRRGARSWAADRVRQSLRQRQGAARHRAGEARRLAGRVRARSEALQERAEHLGGAGAGGRGRVSRRSGRRRGGAVAAGHDRGDRAARAGGRCSARRSSTAGRWSRA